jgi:hypothetical protein
MTLSALIRKRELATVTVATTATHEGIEGRTVAKVAKVATVAVANRIFPEEESAIRAWLAHINETDPSIIADVITKCGIYAETRAWCLELARQVPPAPEPDYTARCIDCRHFQRTSHPHFGHCSQGEPEAIVGLYDTDSRWCLKYEVL